VDQDQQRRADERTDSALAASGSRDPREYYRERLRDLKSADPEAYDRAVQYYREKLVPTLADGDGDPLAAWSEYGQFIAELCAPGRTVEIDHSGRAHAFHPPTPGDRLVIHVPKGRVTRAILVGLPAEPSAAQMATYDLLVAGRQKLRDAESR